MIDDSDWADLLARAGDTPKSLSAPPGKNPVAKDADNGSLTADRTAAGGQAPAHFLHYCRCGQWGAWGYGVDYRRGKNGDWYCFAHRPLNKVAAALTK
jgi:hypothetical protein